MSLSTIYAPVQEDLVLVEEHLHSIARIGFQPLARLLEYSLQGSGKRVRPALVLLAGKFARYNLSPLLMMATAVELLHTATLIHDDAIDDSPVRRGRPTVNKAWDVDKAVLLGDHLFARAEEFAANTGNLRVIRLSAQTLQTLSSGEINQSFNAFNPNQTREQYLKRIADKTAALLATSTECGAVLSDAPEEIVVTLREFGYNLGVCFQLVDDILDFVGTEQELGKPVGSDLAQGTLTLPAMILAERYPDDNPVRKVFEDCDGTARLEYVRRAIEMVRNSSIVDECYGVATTYCGIAQANLKRLPENESRRALGDLLDFMMKRRS